MKDKNAFKPCDLVIYGALGDLSKRKLIISPLSQNLLQYAVNDCDAFSLKINLAINVGFICTKNH